MDQHLYYIEQMFWSQGVRRLGPGRGRVYRQVIEFRVPRVALPPQLPGPKLYLSLNTAALLGAAATVSWISVT